MKKILLVAAAALLMLSMLVGCSKPQSESHDGESSATPTDSAETPSAETTPAQPEDAAQPEDVAQPEDDAQTEEPVDTVQPEDVAQPEEDEQPAEDTPAAVDTAYAEQIERYYTALAEQWGEGAYYENAMSPMVTYYYDGNALDNVGYALMDLNGDGADELIIGAIMNAENDPLVFEIWTMVNGEPVMLAQSGARNRYYMQYAQEDGLWSVAYEAENGAANHAVYYLYLGEGKFEVIQGIIFDAIANENEPWFMTYDLDWDVSNDTPIDEDTAIAVMDAESNNYTNVEYIPYSMYK